MDEEFKFIAERSTPIIVSVFDASGETLEFPLNTEITVRPEPAEKDSAVNEGGDSTAPEGSDQADTPASEDGEVAPAGGDSAADEAAVEANSSFSPAKLEDPSFSP